MCVCECGCALVWMSICLYVSAGVLMCGCGYVSMCARGCAGMCVCVCVCVRINVVFCVEKFYILKFTKIATVFHIMIPSYAILHHLVHSVCLDM